MSGMRSAHIIYLVLRRRCPTSFSSSRRQRATSRAAIWLNGLISSTFILTAIPKISDLSVDKSSCTNGKRTLAIHQCSHAQQGKNKGRSFERPSKIYSINCRLSTVGFLACRYTKQSAVSTSAYAVQLQHTKC